MGSYIIVAVTIKNLKSLKRGKETFKLAWN